MLTLIVTVLVRVELAVTVVVSLTGLGVWIARHRQASVMPAGPLLATNFRRHLGVANGSCRFTLAVVDRSSVEVGLKCGTSLDVMERFEADSQGEVDNVGCGPVPVNGAETDTGAVPTGLPLVVVIFCEPGLPKAGEF